MSQTNGTQATKPLNVFIHSLDGTGHLAACIGLGQAIQDRGHKVTFLINEAFKGQTSLFGFTEIYLIDKPKPALEGAPADSTVNPIKVLAEQLLTSGLLSGKNSLEKLKLMENTVFMEDMYQRTVIFNPQIEAAFKKEKPDLIILDHFMIPPAILRAEVPYVLIFSGNPTMCLNSKKLPPASSGYASNSDPSTWVEFEEMYQNTFPTLLKNFQERINAVFHYEPAEPVKKEFPSSPYLNLYGYPEELDYQDIAPLPKNMIQVDAFCRKMPEPFKIPEELNVKPGDKLIYVSMGSMGSIDVKLNQRIASVLAKTPYKCIFSKGPLADEYKLPANCWGEAFVPQTSLLPLVDLVITHGGNNTVTETFNFGKPMIVLPLFADQFDNAQRVQEKGYGVRLEPYSFNEEELLEAIDRLLNDVQLNERLQAAAKRIKSSNSKDKAVQKMEYIVEQFRKKQNETTK